MEIEEKVSHPSHYTWLKDVCGIEVIDIARYMDFNAGNALKYILRSGHKAEKGYTKTEKQIEDLKKAIWYLEDEIKLLQNNIAKEHCIHNSSPKNIIVTNGNSSRF